MTPLFKDEARDQLVVNLMWTRFPTLNMGGGKFSSDQYFRLIQRGQDEAIEYLQRGFVSETDRP
jgi:hypothetical protein